MTWFERTNINLKKENKYPKVNYEEALNYDQRFAELMAQKKEKKAHLKKDLNKDSNASPLSKGHNSSNDNTPKHNLMK